MHTRAPVAVLQAGPRHRHPPGRLETVRMGAPDPRPCAVPQARTRTRRAAGPDVTATAPPGQFRIRGPAEHDEPGRRPGSDDRILGQGVAGVS